MESPVDERFGRAANFIVVDSATGVFEVHDNTRNLNAAQGAGIQSAEAASRLGADVVITGHCGPKAFQALNAAGIQVVVGAHGTVKEAVDGFKKGDLKPSISADVQGHWG
jgi:predicted Fe-Mo cluster-binding NifX family protein